MKLIFITLTILLFILNCQALFKNELIFDHVELLNGTSVEGIYKYSSHRITKFNRTTYVFNTEFETFITLDESYEMEGIFYYNRLNNNQYTRSVLRAPKSNFCDTLNRFRNLIFTPSNINNHNFPGPNEPICPMKKVNILEKHILN